MATLSMFVFWSALATLLYVYAGFSLLVVVVGLLRNRRVRQADITPAVTLIIPVWNEENTIASRLDNALSLDYPRERLEIIVPSDGSDDDTEKIVARYGAQGVKLMSFPRRGKIYALKDAVAVASGEILVFSDANSMYERNALRMLVRNFADAEVGGVCGNQVYVKAHTAEASSQGETLYWSYDKWLKQLESRAGSIVSAHGAIYAIRRRLYQPPASAAVTDDFAISTAVVEQGYRLVFESEAIAYEEPTATASKEFGRKVRIMNRGLRSVLLRKRLLNPFRYGFYSVELFSHKVLRRLVPFVLFIMLVSAAILSTGSQFFMAVTALQAVFYAFALTGFLLRGNAFGRVKCFYIPFFYCLANAAALVAICKLLSGRKVEFWQPQRHGSAA